MIKFQTRSEVPNLAWIISQNHIGFKSDCIFGWKRGTSGESDQYAQETMRVRELGGPADCQKKNQSVDTERTRELAATFIPPNPLSVRLVVVVREIFRFLSLGEREWKWRVLSAED